MLPSRIIVGISCVLFTLFLSSWYNHQKKTTMQKKTAIISKHNVRDYMLSSPFRMANGIMHGFCTGMLSSFCWIFQKCMFFYFLVLNIKQVRLHCKKELAIFPSSAGMSLTKLFLGGNNLVFSRPERVCSVTSRLGTGKWLTLFYSVHVDTSIPVPPAWHKSFILNKSCHPE